MSAAPVLDPRERFLREIAGRIPPERIAEIHLFPALRSGGRESGVAVIAAVADRFDAGAIDAVPGDAGSPPAAEDSIEPPESAEPSAAAAIAPSPDEADAPADPAGVTPAAELSPGASQEPEGSSGPARLVVYRAIYRWTRKGPDRGRWEVDITAEADAPLHAVSDVVRGVQRRAGEEGDPELITPDALRIALSDRPWAAAM